MIRGKFEERHVDQVWEDIRKPPKLVHDGKTGPQGTTAKQELDAELPGSGQHYCIPCARYFQTATALADHEGTKPHKRKVKMLLNTAKPHNQVDAEVASGMGRPDNGPKLRSHGPAAMEMAQ